MNKGTFDSEIDEQIILATFNKIDIETNHACVDFLRKYANANDFSDNILKVFSKLIKIESFLQFPQLLSFREFVSNTLTSKKIQSTYYTLNEAFKCNLTNDIKVK